MSSSKLTSLAFPQPLRDRIDAYGAETGLKMASVVRIAVLEFLERREPQPLTQKETVEAE